MDIQRSILIVALAVVSYLMVLQWNEDYGQAALPAEVSTSTAATPALPDTPAATASTGGDDIPTAVAEPTAAAVAPTAAVSDELTRVKTDVLDLAMVESSNTLTEVFGRLVAIGRGQEPTFEGATTAVLEAVASLGVDVSGTVLTDTSGLSLSNRISPRLLAELAALSVSDPAMRACSFTARPLGCVARQAIRGDRRRDFDDGQVEP